MHGTVTITCATGARSANDFVVRQLETTQYWADVCHQNAQGLDLAHDAEELAGVTQPVIKLASAYWCYDETTRADRIFPSLNPISSFSTHRGSLKGFYEDIGLTSDAHMIIAEILKKARDASARLPAASNHFQSKKLASTDGHCLMPFIMNELQRTIFEQNIYSDYDHLPPLRKSGLMLRNLLYLYSKCMQNQYLDLIGDRDWLGESSNCLYSFFVEDFEKKKLEEDLDEWRDRVDLMFSESSIAAAEKAEEDEAAANEAEREAEREAANEAEREATNNLCANAPTTQIMQKGCQCALS